ncbi:bile acid:sodium symporter family protein [Crocosphaera sp. XPORK-15E]|uniref:bile acid:sodium symporter family protein n=1 Tax=Crocosphaera sp. XPORK-15E TaxID=3110247 RepID=UPI002B2143A1|nr:bile acid:sodium symporter family protein [Crocosphaera sp. XPORK-15E]MEA5535516.1 bile acid:sodium symporter family protein [Crocosphaera sp. XPORK-15E]
MESNFLTAVFLPLALFIIMMGMGLGLKVDDFKRVLVEPKAVILGLIAQLILLPIVGFLLAGIFPLTPELAVGVMILVACPGGATSNMITYLVRGNVAVSITLTAMSSLITVFTIPMVVNLAMESFMGGEAALQLPILKTVMQIAVITLIPVSLGMLLNYYKPQLATKLEKTVKWLSIFFLALIIFGLLLKERANVLNSLRQVGGVTLTLNIVTMLIGYGIGTVAKLDDSITKAITVEVGIQNGTLAITIASTLLNTPSMAIPAGIYSLLMFVTSAVFALWVRNRKVISID